MKNDKKYIMYKINHETMPKIEFPNSPFEDIKALWERTIMVETVEKIDNEIIESYEKIAREYGINDLILLDKTQIKEFLMIYLPIYKKEKGIE